MCVLVHVCMRSLGGTHTMKLQYFINGLNATPLRRMNDVCNVYLCAIFYCLSRSTSEFLPEYSDFFFFIIHCSSIPFLNIVNSFGLQQHFLGLIHNRGHTLDLVFIWNKDQPHTFHWPVNIDYHLCILFDGIFQSDVVNKPHTIHSHTFNGETVSKCYPSFPTTVV